MLNERKLRDLTVLEIERFAGRKEVRRIAVENFLGTIASCESFNYAMLNLNADAALYKWNMATRNAIAAGIKLSAKPARGSR